MEQTLSNDRQIAYHRQQINPKAIPDTDLTFAYDGNKYVKMCTEIAGEKHEVTTVYENEEGTNQVTSHLKSGGRDDDLIKKVLREINDDFHDAIKINQALDSTILDKLVTCFTDGDDVIRELASRAVMQVARVERGRKILIDNKIVENISKLFEDPDDKIRWNAYNTLIYLADFQFGVDAIITFDIIQILVDRLVLEPEEPIMIQVLTLLKLLLEGERAPSIVLSTQALSRLNDHLKSENKFIRELAALNLGSISYNERGKEYTIKAESIKPLWEMLDDSITNCRIASTRALASLAQLKEGKVEIHSIEGRLDRIIDLLDDPSEQLRLNIVQLIANVAEYPPCREKFKECLKKLQDLEDDENYPLVARFAEVAIKTITWIP